MSETTKITVFQLLSSYFAVVKAQEASQLFQDIQKSFIELKRLGFLIENIDFAQYINCTYSERLLEELEFMIANDILTFSNGSNTHIYRRTPSAWTQEKLIQVYSRLGQSMTQEVILEVIKTLFSKKHPMSDG
ncbi:MAG: hypothetical protein ACFFC7_00120 [Candidatus Hermodarchaeota archaeon]